MAALLAALPGLAVPASASAAGPSVKAAAAISTCKGERAVVAFSLRATSKGDRRVRKAYRRIKGARLSVRVRLLPLFSEARSTDWVELGRRRATAGREQFAGLPADTWAGVVEYRWRKGKSVVGAGKLRTRITRVGKRRGRDLCTLEVGRVPADVTPPTVSLSPGDGAWKRAPLAVRLIATDDLSGVAAVAYHVDGGPVRLGRSLTLSDEGSHRVVYGAEDIAGNRSAPRSDVVRVDGGPPSAPVLDRPPATSQKNPEVRWSAANDSGSGVRTYVVTIRDAAETIVATRAVVATGAATQSVTITDTLAVGHYKAQVFALDGTTPEPFVSASAVRAFEVAGTPNVVDSDPGPGELRAFALRANNLSVTFNRSINPATLGGVKLTRSGSQVAASVTCNAGCTTAQIDPAADLTGGRYRIDVAGVTDTSGAAVASYSASFRASAYEQDFEGGCDFASTGANAWTCGDRSQLSTRELGAAAPTRGCIVDPDKVSTATGPSQPFTAVAGELLRISFRRYFSTNAGGSSPDFGSIQYQIDGGSFQEIRRYPDQASSPDAVDIDPPDGSHTIQLRFTLSIPHGNTPGAGCANPAGAGFLVDDVKLTPLP